MKIKYLILLLFLVNICFVQADDVLSRFKVNSDGIENKGDIIMFTPSAVLFKDGNLQEFPNGLINTIKTSFQGIDLSKIEAITYIDDNRYFISDGTNSYVFTLNPLTEEDVSFSGDYGFLDAALNMGSNLVFFFNKGGVTKVYSSDMEFHLSSEPIDFPDYFVEASYYKDGHIYFYGRKNGCKTSFRLNLQTKAIDCFLLTHNSIFDDYFPSEPSSFTKIEGYPSEKSEENIKGDKPSFTFGNDFISSEYYDFYLNTKILSYAFVSSSRYNNDYLFFKTENMLRPSVSSYQNKGIKSNLNPDSALYCIDKDCSECDNGEYKIFFPDPYLNSDGSIKVDPNIFDSYEKLKVFNGYLYRSEGKVYFKKESNIDQFSNLVNKNNEISFSYCREDGVPGPKDDGTSSNNVQDSGSDSSESNLNPDSASYCIDKDCSECNNGEYKIFFPDPYLNDDGSIQFDLTIFDNYDIEKLKVFNGYLYRSEGKVYFKKENPADSLSKIVNKNGDIPLSFCREDGVPGPNNVQDSGSDSILDPVDTGGTTQGDSDSDEFVPLTDAMTWFSKFTKEPCDDFIDCGVWTKDDTCYGLNHICTNPPPQEINSGCKDYKYYIKDRHKTNFRELYNPRNPNRVCPYSCVSSVDQCPKKSFEEFTISTIVGARIPPQDLNYFEKCPSTLPKKMKLFIPPGTNSISFTIFTYRDDNVFFLSRFLKKPVKEHDASYVLNHMDLVTHVDDYYRIYTDSPNTKNLYSAGMGGHDSIIPSEGGFILSEEDSGWYYIEQLTDFSLIQIQERIHLDYNIYTKWYDSMKNCSVPSEGKFCWDANGNPKLNEDSQNSDDNQKTDEEISLCLDDEGKEIKEGDSKDFYLNSISDDCDSIKQERKCENGVLTGEYPFNKCIDSNKVKIKPVGLSILNNAIDLIFKAPVHLDFYKNNQKLDSYFRDSLTHVVVNFDDIDDLEISDVYFDDNKKLKYPFSLDLTVGNDPRFKLSFTFPECSSDYPGFCLTQEKCSHAGGSWQTFYCDGEKNDKISCLIPNSNDEAEDINTFYFYDESSDSFFPKSRACKDGVLFNGFFDLTMTDLEQICKDKGSELSEKDESDESYSCVELENPLNLEIKPVGLSILNSAIDLIFKAPVNLDFYKNDQKLERSLIDGLTHIVIDFDDFDDLEISDVYFDENKKIKYPFSLDLTVGKNPSYKLSFTFPECSLDYPGFCSTEDSCIHIGRSSWYNHIYCGGKNNKVISCLIPNSNDEAEEINTFYFYDESSDSFFPKSRACKDGVLFNGFFDLTMTDLEQICKDKGSELSEKDESDESYSCVE